MADTESKAIREATAIVKGAAGLQTFLDNYEPGENPTSHVLVWDSRLMVVGHCANTGACIAISSAMQTAAAIARALCCAERVEMYRSTKDQPIYDVVLVPGKRSRNIIAGLLASIGGVARTCKGMGTKTEPTEEPAPLIVFSDHRTRIPHDAADFEGRRAKQ